MPHQQGVKVVAQNRKAFHDYFVEEKLECGVALFVFFLKPWLEKHLKCKSFHKLLVYFFACQLRLYIISPIGPMSLISPKSPIGPISPIRPLKVCHKEWRRCCLG